MGPLMTFFDYSKLRGRIQEKYRAEGKFARDINRSPNYLSKVMMGKANFSAVDIYRIAQALDIPTDEIGLYFFTPRRIS